MNFKNGLKKGVDAVIDFITRNKRFFCAGVVFALIMVVLFCFISPANNTKAHGQKASEKLNDKASKELSTLITDYYTSYAAGDVEALEKIASPISDQEASYIQFYSQYIDEFVNPKIYTKSGVNDGSLIVSVDVGLKFADIDTIAPGCDFFYVEKNEDGKLYINNLYGSFNQTNGIYEMDSDVTALIASYISQEDVMELQTQIGTSYNEAVLKDEKLSNFVNKTLRDAIVEWNTKYAEEKKAEEDTAKEAEETAAKEAEKAEEEEKKAEEKKSKEKSENTKSSDGKKGEVNKNVNVRSQADKESDRLGKLEGGQSVTVLGKEGDFYKIDYNGKEGYVAREFLTVEGEENVEPEENNSSTSFEEGETVTLKSTVNIREKMDTSSSKVAVAYAGDKVTVVMSYSEGWTKVKFGKKEGYIKTELL